MDIDKKIIDKVSTLKDLNLDSYTTDTKTSSRSVTIATDAFKILADHWIHRALVIFKNNDSDNYRFSYLTITLDLNDKNNKTVKKYSNARRYSTRVLHLPSNT